MKTKAKNFYFEKKKQKTFVRGKSLLASFSSEKDDLTMCPSAGVTP